MIEKASIENLKNRLDIVDVVSSYIELKKAGANFKASCPFHGENTPSFVVSPQKQIYKCFGCGASGDSIKFVMEYEKLSYPETIEKLAREYNVTLNYTKNDKQDSLYNKRVLENVNLFFRKRLNTHQEAKEYLKNRGVYDSSIEKFELGFAPSSSETLKFLNQNSVSIDEAKEFGIVAMNDNGRVYARFTNRITFPIFSSHGKLVGFGGRIIVNRNDVGKYINSPQSKFFNKSTLLYGYHKAKQSIFQKGEIIIVEGNLDVIMLHQAGFTNSVATLGTALGESHLPLLKRGEPKIILAYDGDKAGKEAAFKAAKMLSLKSYDGGVVVFPAGVDPADMVKNGQIEELNKLFHKPKVFIEYCLEYIISRFNLDNPLQKEVALKESIAYLKTLTPILQDEYKEYLAAILNINRSLIKLNQSSNKLFTKSGIQQNEDIAELTILKTLLEKPSLIEMVLNIVDIKLFKNTHRAFLALINNKDDDMLTQIALRDDIGVYSEEELKKQLLFFLIRQYNYELAIIKKDTTLSFKKKSFLMRKIKVILEKLKKGELIAYESISTV